MPTIWRLCSTAAPLIEFTFCHISRGLSYIASRFQSEWSTYGVWQQAPQRICNSSNSRYAAIYCEIYRTIVNTWRPRQNGRHFADGIFKCIFLNENVWILIKISMNFVPEGPINNIPALVQIMAWCRPGDKPLSEPMMVSLTTHICVTRPQCVKMRLILSDIASTFCVYIHNKFVCDIYQNINRATVEYINIYTRVVLFDILRNANVTPCVPANVKLALSYSLKISAVGRKKSNSDQALMVISTEINVLYFNSPH